MPTEEPAYVLYEQIGDLHGGEVASAVELRPVLDLVVHHRPHERLGGEHRPPLRRRAGRAPFGRVSSLVQEAGVRGSGTGKPVDRDVGEQLVEVDGILGKLGRSVGPLLEVLEDPGELANRRVVERVSDGLGTVRLELEVPRTLLAYGPRPLHGRPVIFGATLDPRRTLGQVVD